MVARHRRPALTWDGQRLPGVWLTARAIDIAVPRARQYGTATVVIRRSHHIACLGAFLTRATDQGLMILLASSDPADRQRRAVRRHHGGVHARPDRGRHPDRAATRS